MLHIDFETRSDLDLTNVGAHNYAKGKNTDILCMAYAFGDENVELWTPGERLSSRITEYIEAGGPVWAHNASFEREMCNNVGVRKYGFPYLYDDQLVCTQAMAYSMALPASLEKCAAALGISEQKDMAGSRVMLQLCSPREVLPDGTLVWWQEPEKFKILYDYCLQDVRVERLAGKRMLQLSAKETEIWRLDQKINSRGIYIDIPAAKAATAMVAAEKIRLDAKMREISDNKVATCNSLQQIKDYLTENGVKDVESLAKNDVIDLLKTHIPLPCRKVLELRQEAGLATTAKVSAMVERSGLDSRFRGGFQYSGANTRRWAARGIQLQNLKRPKIHQSVIDYILDALPKGLTALQMDAVCGPPLQILSECIRGFITSAPGHLLLACDFSSIEARVLAWLANQESKIKIFNNNEDVYKHAAAGIFQRPIERIDSSQRFVGKIAELALGYGGGVGALQTMAQGYGLKLAPTFETLWQLASVDEREWVEKAFHSNRKRFDEISREEYIASDLTKMNWRHANTKIVEFWSGLESAAMSAVSTPNVKVSNPEANIQFLFKGSFLFCRLPSNGVICYPYPEIQGVTTPWGSIKRGLTYMTEVERKWVRTKTYGGSLAENVTQSVARDLLAEAMLRLEKSGFSVVMHAHDEAVCEIREIQREEKTLEKMIEIMTEVPGWAKGLPITAGGFSGKRYRK